MNRHLIKIIVDYLIIIEDINKAIKDMEYPFSYIDDYKQNLFRPSLNSSITEEQTRDFPNDIEEVYYYEQEFENYDDQNWRLICKNKNNIYYYYEAVCDHTGFTCQAGMDLRAYHDFDDFIELGVNKSVADKFRNNNKIYKEKVISIINNLN